VAAGFGADGAGGRHLRTGRELGVDMPVISGFEEDLAQFAALRS
jgi:hypothetical protein